MYLSWGVRRVDANHIAMTPKCHQWHSFTLEVLKRFVLLQLERQ